MRFQVSAVRSGAGRRDDLKPSDVEAVFRAFLGRAASPGDIESWMRGGSLRGLIDGVLCSAEYAARSTADATRENSQARTFLNCWIEGWGQYCRPRGEVSPDGAAIVGDGGHLFIYGGTNSNVAMQRAEVDLPPHWLDEWRALVAARRASAASEGWGVVFVVVPEKLAVYADRYPSDLKPRGPRPVLRLLREGGLPLVYPLESLREARSEGDTYLFTDSHLTARGNLILAAAVVGGLGVSATLLPQAREPSDFYLASGDLGRHFEPPVVEFMRPFGEPSQAAIVADNRAEVASVGGHIGTIRVFRRDDSADERTVVVFGDSYGFGDESYRGLSWHLAQIFREVHFVWAPFGWDPGYVSKVGAELVVCETAERFVGRVPMLAVDADLLAHETIARHQALSEAAVLGGS